MIQVYFFTQPGCAPCLEAKPLFYEIADRFTTIQFDEVDLTESAGNKQLADSFEVIGTPSIVIVKDGEFIARMNGLRSTQDGTFEIALLNALGGDGSPPESPEENPEEQNEGGTGKAVGFLLLLIIGLKVTNVI